jgi:hypothetical protein
LRFVIRQANEVTGGLLVHTLWRHGAVVNELDVFATHSFENAFACVVKKQPVHRRDAEDAVNSVVADPKNSPAPSFSSVRLRGQRAL